VFLNGIDQAVRSHKEKSSKVVLFGQGEWLIRRFCAQVFELCAETMFEEVAIRTV
jgi:hypothetical protein